MENEFIPYEQALELKELGFDEPCFGKIYADGGSEQLSYPYKNSDQIGKVTSCSAPLYQQVFKWFREKHSLFHSINPLGYNMCLGLVVGQLGKLKPCNVPNYGTYKEAELACLNKLIMIVKQQKTLNDGRTI
jgi:hypothetical protein